MVVDLETEKKAAVLVAVIVLEIVVEAAAVPMVVAVVAAVPMVVAAGEVVPMVVEEVEVVHTAEIDQGQVIEINVRAVEVNDRDLVAVTTEQIQVGVVSVRGRVEEARDQDQVVESEEIPDLQEKESFRKSKWKLEISQ